MRFFKLGKHGSETFSLECWEPAVQTTAVCSFGVQLRNCSPGPRPLTSDCLAQGKIDWEQEDAGSFLAPLQEASHGSFVVAGRFKAPSHVCNRKGHAQIF